MKSLLCAALFCGAVLFATQEMRAQDPTWLYTVQVCATVQPNPPAINLTWPPDTLGATNYTVFRKGRDDTDWGEGIPLGVATNYIDTNVLIGQTYEYQIVKNATLGYTGYGYVYSGIDAPLTDSRGKLVLIVATNSTIGLSNDLAQLQADLTGDGWEVLRHDVSSNDTPDSVRTVITNEYYADPANVNTVFLFGHVPILHSGELNYDTHYTRPMPADGFYGDVSGDWSGSPSFFPTNVTLMVGRVDLFDMPGAGAAKPWPGEVELLKNYLKKDHNWRFKLINVPSAALVGDRRGAENGEATSASGYRVEPLVGHGNVTTANTQDSATPAERWIGMLAANRYMWAFGCGGGYPTFISGLGTNQPYYTVSSYDIVGQDAHAVFVMLFGSFFGNWDIEDDIMRSVLATPTMGLTACMAGRPHWFMHHMGLGETIGYSTRLSMNNSTLYQNDVNNFTQAVYVSLMGDPSLRLYPIAPPSSLSAKTANGTVSLSWKASPDANAGYHVYRAGSAGGPFARITDAPLTATRFSETGILSNAVYMVRAIALQTTPSGTFTNASQGVFATGGEPGVAFLNVQIVGSGSVSDNGKLLDIGKTYTIGAKPAGGFKFAGWSGSISNSSPTIKLTVEPGLDLTATFVDVQPPRLVITSPSSGHKYTQSVINANGKASDNGGLASVFYNFDTNGWMLATGTTNWSAPGLNLIPGKNTLQAYAVDTSGNISKTNSISFQLLSK